MGTLSSRQRMAQIFYATLYEFASDERMNGLDVYAWVHVVRRST